MFSRGQQTSIDLLVRIFSREGRLAALFISFSSRGVYLPNNQGAIPQLPPFLLPSPFPLSPLTSSPPSPSIPYPSFIPTAKRPPRNQQGGLGSAVSSPSGVDIDYDIFWERKNSFDSNYYMDFCILKFVKLLIKSPQNCPWRICRQR